MRILQPEKLMEWEQVVVGSCPVVRALPDCARRLGVAAVRLLAAVAVSAVRTGVGTSGLCCMRMSRQ